MFSWKPSSVCLWNYEHRDLYVLRNVKWSNIRSLEAPFQNTPDVTDPPWAVPLRPDSSDSSGFIRRIKTLLHKAKYSNGPSKWTMEETWVLCVVISPWCNCVCKIETRFNQFNVPFWVYYIGDILIQREKLAERQHPQCATQRSRKD